MPKTGRLQRKRKPPGRYGFEDMTTYASISNSGRDDMVAYALTVEPSTYPELVEGHESGQHKATMNEEMESLNEEN